MWKSDKTAKKTVELNAAEAQAAASAPRRSIRRDPVRINESVDPPRGLFANVDFKSREWEIGMGIAGIILFALAINAILFGVSATIVK